MTCLIAYDLFIHKESEQMPLERMKGFKIRLCDEKLTYKLRTKHTFPVSSFNTVIPRLSRVLGFRTARDKRKSTK